VPGLDATVRRSDVAQLHDLVDDRTERAVGDGGCKPVEIRTRRAEQDAVKAEVAVHRLFEVTVELDDRRKRTGILDRGEAAEAESAPDEIDDGVETAAAPLDRGDTHVLALVVERPLDSELVQQRLAAGAGAARNANPLRVCQLHEHASDSAGSAVHEHRPARLEPEPVEHLEGGRPGERQRGRLDGVEVRRPAPDERGGQPDILGVGAELGAPDRQDSPDGVAGLDALHPLADLLDRARELVTDHIGRSDAGPGRVEPIAGIDRIDPCRSDPRDHASGARFRRRQIAQVELLRPAGRVDDDRAHLATTIGNTVSEAAGRFSTLDWMKGALLVWYRTNGRDLPWRNTRDPYAILVSEVMLQQTQVERVIPRYEAWLARWPTVAALAAATPADVIVAWQGLGYNRRAVNLHRAGRQVAEHGWPDDLTELPGVGPYTAAAVGNFAFGRDVLPVDVNVARVQERTGETFDATCAQALFDLGARVCLARIPRCEVCPLEAACPSRGRRYEPLRKQSKFEGSFRQRRARVLRAVAAGEQPADGDALVSLARDGLVELVDGVASLPA
jgi:A/G-specific adenine glycosylase